jgi:N-acetylneuraminic acid mutarotase
MKTKIFLHSLVILILFFFITCSKESPPELRVNADSFTFTACARIEPLIISNSGDGELSWEITDKPDWLETSKSSGMVTTGVDTVIITAEINQELGTYSGTININSNGGNKDVTISLTIDIWTKGAHMITARAMLGVAEVDGKIYAIGGLLSEEVALSNVEVYDPVTNTWMEKTPMPTARFCMGCAVVNGKIYLIGGSTGSTAFDVLATVEVYDPVTDTWDTTKTPMPTRRAHISASAVKGKIYVMGGTKQGGAVYTGLNTVEVYDPATDTWETKISMPTSRFGLSTSVLDEKIYAIGGRRYPEQPNIVSIVEMYDPLTDEWTEKRDMPTQRYDQSSSVINGKIYAIAGYYNCTNGPIYQRVEEYDPVEDKWIVKTDLPDAIGGLGTCSVNGKIYAMGGTTTTHPFTRINTVYAYDPVADPRSLEYSY